MDYPKPINSIDELPKRYGGIEREKFWQDYWMGCGVYDYDPKRPREEVYTVDTPPPTVSGALHIGHVFSYTQTDFSVRYQRMAGKHVFYPFGFDDNGLPSERLVERVTGKRAHEVGREEFIKLCAPILEEAEQEFKDLWQSVALSCDWTQFYTTIDERSRAISQASFIDLYQRGYIYRKEAPTQWCWADQTAIAQAEIYDREVEGVFHDITFHIDDGSGKLTPVTIATTRPELIPACVAVFAHPDDERYKHLFGKKAVTPLFEVEVPILPSVKADPEKGTGILMCCTFGDTDDVEHWEHKWPEDLVPGGKLGTRVVINRAGKIGGFYFDFQSESLSAPVKDDQLETSEVCILPSRNPETAATFMEEMKGLKINQAQKWIREKLDETGYLTKAEKITHVVRHSERGKVPIEILVTPQWYINLLDHKQELIEQGRKVNWYPEYMRKRYEHWVEGLNQDWCISRQRYNGVPFPVWYDPMPDVEKDGVVIFTPRKINPVLASIEQLPVNPLVDKPEGHEGRLDTLVPEADVMDTWATSSLTPLLNTLLIIGKDEPEIKERHDRIFPYDLRPQAHDIIRTWAFYTIAKAYYHFDEIPWKDIVISGHAQDVGRKKITKSDGHTVTPAEMVTRYTADGLRYWASSCKLGTDTLYDEEKLGEGKKLINKLFNATKFALRHLLDFEPPMKDGKVDIDALLELVTYPTDRWMLKQLQKAEERATKANEIYEFGDAKQAAEDFFWADFCDNYLELSKGRLYRDHSITNAHPNAEPEELRKSAQAALFIALGAVLRLFAPIMPHICEECWSWYHAQWSTLRSIHEEPWPTYDCEIASESDIRAGDQLVQLIALVRKWKSERNVSIKKPVERLTIYVSDKVQKQEFSEARISVMGDLLSTSNAKLISVAGGVPPDDAAAIEGMPYSVVCELAAEET